MTHANSAGSLGDLLGKDERSAQLFLDLLLPFLDLEDVLRCHSVCTLWNDVLKRLLHGRALRLSLDKEIHSDRLLAWMEQRRTSRLEAYRCRFSEVRNEVHSDVYDNLSALHIDNRSGLCYDLIDRHFVETIVGKSPNLRSINLRFNDKSFLMDCLTQSKLPHLTELIVETQYIVDPHNQIVGVIKTLPKLKTLRVICYGYQCDCGKWEDGRPIARLEQDNTTLESLTLCGSAVLSQFGANFEHLKALRKLCFVDSLKPGLLREASRVVSLRQLTLYYLDSNSLVKEELKFCTNIDVLNVYSHVFDFPVSNSMVDSVKKLSDTLKVFHWTLFKDEMLRFVGFKVPKCKSSSDRFRQEFLSKHFPPSSSGTIECKINIICDCSKYCDNYRTARDFEFCCRLWHELAESKI